MRSLPLIALVSDKTSATATTGQLDASNCDNQCVGDLASCSVSVEAPGYVCNCPPGYLWEDDACKDIDECLTETQCVGPVYKCTNTVGSSECGCNDGYEMDLETNECKDKNECESGENDCDNVCINTVGSFDCACSSGYILDTVTNSTCIDVDECVDTTLCGDDTCVNLAGAYKCDCATTGYIYNSNSGVCEDEDECANNVCSTASDCVNSDGSYSCTCKEGYVDKNGDGHVCEWTKYPEYYTWLPTASISSMYYFSVKDGFDGAFNNMKKAKDALNAMGSSWRGMLCEEFFDMPAHTLKPDHYYICDDADQTLSHSRYSNKNRNNCVWKNYQVTCGHSAWGFPAGSDVRIDFIAVSTGNNGCYWDNENGNAYDWPSNQGNGQKYDTALCHMTVASQLEAAQVCAAYGGSLFQEEVKIHAGSNSFDNMNCDTHVENYAKARGRLYQIEKIGAAVGIDASAMQVLTGYRANDSGDAWCWIASIMSGWGDDGVCLPRGVDHSDAPIGTFIDHTDNWQQTTDGLQCHIEAVADSLNGALQTGMENIQTVVADRALLWDIAQETYVQAPKTNSFTDFVCERYAWNCNDANTCPDTNSVCKQEGYCECKEGYFLNGNKECVEEPEKLKIECYDDHMVAYFAIDSINRVDPNQPLHLTDGCGDQITMVDGYYRVHTDLDKCGTFAEYRDDAQMEKVIVFSNFLNNAGGSTTRNGVSINLATKVNSKFECHYRMQTTVSDVNGYASDLDEPCEDDGTGLCGGGPGGIGVNAATASLEKKKTGSFSYELKVYDSDGFNTDLSGAARVGETLHFGIVPTKKLDNVVHRATRCTVSDFEDKEEYVLFDAAVGSVGTVDPFVHTTRYAPLYTDVSGQATCGVSDIDKFSYTVFEFVDKDTGNPVADGKQHIKCTVEVCIKEDDMSTGPCASTVCEQMWSGNTDSQSTNTRLFSRN